MDKNSQAVGLGGPPSYGFLSSMTEIETSSSRITQYINGKKSKPRVTSRDLVPYTTGTIK